MKKLMTKKVVSALIVLSLALTSIFVFASGASALPVGYQVSGAYDEAQNRLNVSVSVSGATVLVGRFGIDYDETKLEPISDGNALSQTALPKNSMSINSESYPVGDYFSRDEGYLLFAWYSSSGARDARETALELCQIRFKLKDGVSVSDLDANSLKLWYTDSGSSFWESAAVIRDNTYVDYKNGVATSRDCVVSFDYPGSDKAPDNAFNATVKLTDTTGAAISGDVVIGTTSFKTGSDGIATMKLANGTYNYRASKDNYGTVTGPIVINGADVTVTVKLATSQTLVKEAADALEIQFADGDSAGAVTQNIGLASKGEYNTAVSWASSDYNAINQYGVVNCSDSPVSVTLTATVSKDGYTAQKTFMLTVAAEKDVDPTNPGGGTGFTDLSGYDWARQQIMYLYNAGIIKGTSATTFSPGASVTRADFVVLLIRMLNPQNVSMVAGFKDVSEKSYYYNEVTIAKSLGIAHGDDKNNFRPEDTISRQDMMTLTYRALVEFGYIEEATNSSNLSSFSDSGSVADYAKLATSALVRDGLIEGAGNNQLLPLKAHTRAEAAVLIYRIYISALSN